ncbi:hypothetical protein [Leptospira mtsangambouensis]|uniref:hypothetical protein n=1 Tax=Leptospira mtsangambouensis TaxID=2484912 RepID=UPI001EEB79EB|nr:hypothetical protein [Leptospira mtsangambouensis]MCG6140659.1 hypothetical protein [Leptospira mtsangambouensis]
MTKTERLNELFIEWESSYPKYKDRFVSDGIINESEFEKTNPKILVIAKESNNPKQLKEDYRVYWANEIKYRFSHRIAEWSYGILNDFPELNNLTPKESELKTKLSMIHKIAFMNLKKIGGGSTTIESDLKEYIEEDKAFILREIEIINPDIIVGGIGNHSFWRILFPEIEMISSESGRFIAKVGKMKIISFYHPSSWLTKAEIYLLLKKIFKSDSFTNL